MSGVKHKQPKILRNIRKSAFWFGWEFDKPFWTEKWCCTQALKPIATLRKLPPWSRQKSQVLSSLLRVVYLCCRPCQAGPLNLVCGRSVKFLSKCRCSQSKSESNDWKTLPDPGCETKGSARTMLSQGREELKDALWRQNNKGKAACSEGRDCLTGCVNKRTSLQFK